MNRRVSWDPSTGTLWSPFTRFNSKRFLFFNHQILSRESRYKALKKRVGLFYIRFQWKVMQCFVNRHKETQSKPTGIAVNVNVLRISKFAYMVLLVIYVAIISTNLRIIEKFPLSCRPIKYTLRAKNTFQTSGKKTHKLLPVKMLNPLVLLHYVSVWKLSTKNCMALKNSNFETILSLKAYGNLKTPWSDKLLGWRHFRQI